MSDYTLEPDDIDARGNRYAEYEAWEAQQSTGSDPEGE